MRKLVQEFGRNDRNEDWIYLELDEATSQLFYVHEWSYTGYSGGTDVGEVRKPLHSAAGEKYFRYVADAVKAVFIKS